jgi:hypothetical protein
MNDDHSLTQIKRECRVEAIVARLLKSFCIDLQFYKLEERLPVLVEDPVEWALLVRRIAGMPDNPWCVAETIVGGTRINTVFLGLHRPRDVHPPKLFQTTISGDQHPMTTWKSATWQHAERRHQLAVHRLRNHLRVVK